MKKLEIIRKIFEEDRNLNLYNLIDNDETKNLTILCILNKKYLTKENFNIIISHKLKTKYINDSNHEVYYIDYSNLADLIGKYPDLLNKIPKKIKKEFSIGDWVSIISDQPNLIDDCDRFYDLDANDWKNILEKQPQLASKYVALYNKFTFYDVYTLADKNKDILKYIDIKNFEMNELNLARILSISSEVVKDIDEDRLKEISPKNWVNILKNDPELIKVCPIVKNVNKYLYNNVYILIELILNQPKLGYLLSNVKNIRHYNLIGIVKKNPKLLDDLNIKIDFKQYNDYTWGEILSKQPQLINKCDIIKSLPPNIWAFILEYQPKLINYCNQLDKFSSDNWYRILKNNPNLIDKCNVELSERNRIDLLELQPSLIAKINLNTIYQYVLEKVMYNSKEYHVEFINKYIEQYKDQEVLTNMIGIYPDLKEIYTKNNLWKYVDFNQLTENLEYSILK